ncbi:hypothetical protein [Microscilla marina]|uniref:Uncharacterized protein n=1 Tax=Microscilla marina ATCC 23134 TaxID=313606 RepID=A1ZD87_MICM2|nr:hypothetical protein [Microscilla marina]EAY31626.1 hypothetical protein M23134_05132 [Microscilla marina ATCC 23134]
MMDKHQQKLDPPGFWEEEFFGEQGDLYDQDEVLEKHDWVKESIEKTAAIKKQILTKEYETHSYKGYAVDGSFYNFWRRHHEAEQIKMSYLEFKKFNDHLDWNKGAQEGDEIHLPLGAQYISMDDLMKLDATKNDYAVYLDKAKNLILSNPHIGYISPQRLDSIDMRPDEKIWANKSDEVNPPNLKYLRYVVLLNDDFAFISQKTGLPEQVLKAGLEGPLQPGVSIRINPNQGNMILNFEKWAAQAKHSGALLSQMSLTQGHSNNFIHIIWMETYSFFARVYNNDSFETVTHQFITNAIQAHNKDKWIPPSNGNNPIGDNIDEKGFADVVVAWLDGTGSKHMYVYTYSSQLNRVEYKCTYEDYVQAKYDRDDEKKRKEEEAVKKDKEALAKNFKKNGTTTNLPGFYQGLGETINKMVPNDGSKAKLEVELTIPLGIVWGGFHGMFEIENDGGNIKVHCRLGLMAKRELGGFIEVALRAGGYIEAQGKTGQHAMELFLFNFYHWLRMKASGLVHSSLLNELIETAVLGVAFRSSLSPSKKAGAALHLFLNGAFSRLDEPKKAAKDFKGAERWANIVKSQIKNGEYYTESGFYFKFTAALDLAAKWQKASKFGAEVEVDLLFGNRIDKDSIKNAEAQREDDNKPLAPSPSDYYPLGEDMTTQVYKIKGALTVPDPSDPAKILDARDKGSLEIALKIVNGEQGLKEVEVEIVPSIDSNWALGKLKGMDSLKAWHKWMGAGFLSTALAGVGLLSRDKKAPVMGDAINVMTTALSRIPIDKIAPSIGSSKLGIKNYFQLSIKYKYVPPQKGKKKGEKSIEFIMYDTQKFYLDLKAIKIEFEKSNPLSPKLPIKF